MEHHVPVLNRLQRFGLVLNPSKRVFSVPSSKSLGHNAYSFGIYLLPSKVVNICEFPQPPLTPTASTAASS
ncbi:hypothetical protein SprV_0501926000 [Sparganum proliferum]